MNLAHLLAMSGYGSYVWSAFGLTVVMLMALYFSARFRLKKALDKQSILEKN